MTWPQATVQTCVVHLVRNSLRYASKADWAPITKGLRAIYTAPTIEAATVEFDTFADTWHSKYPAMIRSWENTWDEFTPFFAFRVELRVDQQHRVHAVEWPVLPGEHVSHDSVGDLRDRLARQLGLVDLLEMGLDLTGRHPLRIERHDLLGQPFQTAGMLGHRDRLERRVPITRHLHLHRPDIGHHRLRIGTVSAVARPTAINRVGFVAEMVFELDVQPRL